MQSPAKQQQQPPYDDDYRRKREKHLNKMRHISSIGLTKFGVPMSPGMVLRKSASLYRLVIPTMKDLVIEERRIINKHHDSINKKTYIVFVLMVLMILLVIVGLGSWKPCYAAYAFGFLYLCFLWKKERELEEHRAKISELVLKKRKQLPMVAVDSVEADQRATDLINLYSYTSTLPLGSAMSTFIYCSAVTGIFCLILALQQ